MRYRLTSGTTLIRVRSVIDKYELSRGRIALFKARMIGMKWLNYNHLYYFWIVAREGSIARAAEELMVSQPTISIQIKDLEQAVGQKLFDRVGRGLQLTDAGRIASNYANEIFSLGQEMTNALEHQPAGRPLKLSVGILDVIPKPVVRQLLEPALRLPQPVRLICREDKAERAPSPAPRRDRQGGGGAAWARPHSGHRPRRRAEVVAAGGAGPLPLHGCGRAPSSPRGHRAALG